MQPVPVKTQPAPAKTSRPTHVRHVVLGLTVAAYMITYMDRQVLAVARPVIRDELGISLVMMGWITFAFRMAYALFQIPGGWLGDRFGARRALTAVVTWWSVFTALDRPRVECGLDAHHSGFLRPGRSGRVSHCHPFARPLDASHRARLRAGHHARRLATGLGPHAARPRRLHHLRAQWTGIIPSYGWRAAFLFFGLARRRLVCWSGISTIATLPRNIAGVNQAERDLIGAGRKRSSHIPWRKILSHGNLWILSVMYFCYNFNLNVYQDWFPTYLHDSRGMTLAKMGIYASLPLFAGVLGDLAGGSFSDSVLKRTGNVNLARRWVAIAGFIVSAAATIPAVFTHDPKVSVAFYCLAFFGARMDRRHLLGHPARYRRRFRRLRLRRHEHARQHRWSALRRRRHVCGDPLRLERALHDHQRAVYRRRGPLS